MDDAEKELEDEGLSFGGWGLLLPCKGNKYHRHQAFSSNFLSIFFNEHQVLIQEGRTYRYHHFSTVF